MQFQSEIFNVKSSIAATALMLMFMTAAAAHAQTFRGGISGRVTDPSGAVLPGVTVTATNNGTGVARTTISSESGDFSLPDLPLGTYTVETALAGFQTVKVTVEVTVSRVSSID